MLRPNSAWSVAFLGVFAAAIFHFTLVFAESDQKTETEDISHGLGHHIKWQTLENGFRLAKEENKPMMLIIHKSWCSACGMLIPKLRKSKEMAELSEKFIMVNTQDNDEAKGEVYVPDGKYVPRILFFNPEGILQKDIINEGGLSEYKYYYADAISLVQTMTKVAEMFPLTLQVENEKTAQDSKTEAAANEKTEQDSNTEATVNEKTEL